MHWLLGWQITQIPISGCFLQVTSWELWQPSIEIGLRVKKPLLATVICVFLVSLGLSFWQVLTCQAPGLSPEMSWGAVAAPCFQSQVAASCWLAMQRTWCFLTTPHQAQGGFPAQSLCWSLLGTVWAGLESRLQAGRGAWSPHTGLGRASLFLTLDTVLRVTAPWPFTARERQWPAHCLPHATMQGSTSAT